MTTKTKQTKRCTLCKKYKPLNAFPKKKTGKHGVDSQCKACKNARTRERRTTPKLPPSWQQKDIVGKPTISHDYVASLGRQKDGQRASPCYDCKGSMKCIKRVQLGLHVLCEAPDVKDLRHWNELKEEHKNNGTSGLLHGLT